MNGTFFIFSDKKLKERENTVRIGSKGDYPSLESYLQRSKDHFIYDFTKNHLNKNYFSEDDCFISFVHENSLQLRLEEPLIPRRSIVITGTDIDLEDALLNKYQYEDIDYDIFSGDTIEEEISYKDLIFDSMRDLVDILYYMLDSGYLDLVNTDKIPDWVITFQDPITDIFVRYHRLETSAPDISTTEEFLINPEFRKTITIMLMKIISNFIVNNNILSNKDTEDYDSWMDISLWNSIREKIKNEF